MDIEGPEDCDLLVIGASLTGSAIARDASGRGLKVCLIERGDLAATAAPAALALGSVSAAGDRAAVREAQAERARLLAIAPHAVRPIRVVTPEGSGDWRARAAALLADHAGARGQLAPPARVDLARAPHTALLQPGLGHGREETDGALDEARLVVLNCLDAAERGASIRLRSPARALKRRSEHWEALVRTPQGEHRIEARAVINAAGPWTGEVLAMAFPGRASHTPMVVSDHHMIVPRLYSGGHGYRFAAENGGQLAILPHGRDGTLVSLIGTPVPSDAPAASAANPAVIRAAARAFVRAPLEPTGGLGHFARLRAVPDPAGDHASVRGGLMLEPASEAGAPAFLTVSGGPLVTHRLRAEDALERLGAPGRRWTATTPLPGGNIDWLRYPVFIADQQRRWPWLSPHTTARLARTYGTRMARILADAKSPTDLGVDLGGGLTSAELAYLVTHEFARSAEDVLWRRAMPGHELGAQDQARVAEWFARVALEHIPTKQDRDMVTIPRGV